MSPTPDREFVLSVFLLEAWDTLSVVEEVMTHLAEPGGVPEDALDSLRVVTHRLKGSAALYGLRQVSALGAAMEEIVEQACAAPPEERTRAIESLGDIVDQLKTELDALGTVAAEQEVELSELAAAPAVPAPAVPEVAGRPAGPGAAGGPAVAGTVTQGLDELRRFFAENADVLEYFGPEASEHLEVMSQSLLALEQSGASDAEIATLFRAVHTLKGAAYTVGCRVIGSLAHRIEDLLGAVREHQMSLTPAVIEAVFAGADALKLMLRSAEEVSPELAPAVERANALLALVSGAERAAEATPAAAVGAEPTPMPSLPAPVEEPQVEAASELTPAAVLPPAAVQPTAPERPGAPARPTAPERRGSDDRRSRPSIRVNLDRLDALMNLVGELVIARSRLERRLAQLEQVGELLVFSQSRMAQTVREFETKYLDPRLPMPGLSAAPAGGAAPTPAPTAKPEPLGEVFEELEFDRYDDFNILARSVGEISRDISEIQTRLATLLRSVRDDTGQVQRLSGELRNEITRARMVPIGRLFTRFARQVREAARAVGKNVVLDVSGEAVEMDNTIIEQIADPMLHLVQNAITHGIEPEAERRAKGKPPHGTVYLRAYHKGGAIYVEVADDGRGIDVSVVKRWALERGFLRPDMAPLLTERDLLDLIFLPGFSTAAAVTTSAGRGVGMDVVRTNVSRLGGEIDVETEVGAGTRFTIKLPLTVAISDAFLVRVGEEILAVPVAAVKMILFVQPGEVQTVGGAEMIPVEEQLVDLVRMDRALGLPPAPANGTLPVLALRAGRRTLAVAVDELLGKEEIVIKSLGAFLNGVGPYSGATISGEGRVILLVEPSRLVEASGPVEPGARIPAAAASDGRDRAPGRGRPAGRRVLLVDDSISIRKFVGQMLDRAGFEVFSANDGADALQQLADLEVDVIVTDLEMPRVNGYELIRDLKRRPTTRELPIVVLTTRAGEKHVNLARQLGISHYVTKPVDEQAFVRLLESILAPGGALREEMSP